MTKKSCRLINSLIPRLDRIVNKRMPTKENKSKKLVQELKRRSTKSTGTKKQTGAHGAVKGIEVVSISADTPTEKYTPTLPSDMITPKTWELQNRKSFYQWLMENYGKYETGDPRKRRIVAGEGLAVNPKRKVKQLQPIQKLVRDLNSTESPYRGMLLFYGLGVGKTISAIAVSEAIHNRKGVVVLSKAALEPNFIGNIKKGGQDYMVQNNYWVFCSSKTDAADGLRESLGIPAEIAAKHGGFYLIDFSVKDSNYNELSSAHREQLEAQLDAIISKRFTFMHTDNTRLFRKIKPEDFDDKIVIVDEVHNLTNNMTKPDGSGSVFYKIFMNAKNAKFIFLTGTPIINTVYEASRLFNILRGYINVIEFKFQTVFGAGIDFKKLKTQILQNRNVDQIVISQASKTIKVTKNPDGYLTSRDPDQPGVIYSVGKPFAGELQTLEELRDSIDRLFKSQGFKYIIQLKQETALPEDQDEFEQLFYNPEINKLKKTDLFKKRIAGLTSYYDFKDPEKFPSVTNNGVPHLVLCPMSDYQLGIYERFRHEEIQKDKKAARRKDAEEKMTSTYRIHSRMACTFVYPDDMPNPYDMKYTELMEAQAEKLAAAGEEIPDIELENEKAIEKFVKDNLLKTLRRNKAKYFNMQSGALAKLSPKYLAMLNNIQKQDGSILVYSYFKTLIGLNMFSIALDATGEWEPFKIRKIDGLWHLVTDNPEFPSSQRSRKDELERSVRTARGSPAKPKKRYVFYSGDEDREYKTIIPFVFNSEFDRLPGNCAPLVASLRAIYGEGQNLRGEIIKCMMTTKTGAEGLDLKHVRHVHISEPYWQPVLIEQVIGRAVRTESHIRLPPDERNVSVYIYMATILPNQVNQLTQVDVRQDVAKYSDGLNKKGKVVTSDETLFITSERKKVIVGELLNLIKDSAVDCSLNYADNIKQSPGIVCMDYNTKDREDYLFTPGIDDTMDIINVKQEYTVAEQYTKFAVGGVTYYYNTFPTSDGKTFIYDETVMTKTRKPNPVGQIIFAGGKMKVGFFPKKTASGKKGGKSKK